MPNLSDEELLELWLSGVRSGAATTLASMGFSDEHVRELAYHLAGLIHGDPLAREEILNEIRMKVSGGECRNRKITVFSKDTGD